MSTKLEATVEDLARLPSDQKAELVNGELVLMSPTGALPGYGASEVLLSLKLYARQAKTGHALGDNVGFVVNLPHRRSFSPDASFFTGELTMTFVDGAPLVAVEVRSSEVYGKAAERKMAAKRADYFAAGTQVVFDIDMLGEEVVRAYYAAAALMPVVSRRGQEFHAEPALPGWSMKVDDLFPAT